MFVREWSIFMWDVCWDWAQVDLLQILGGRKWLSSGWSAAALKWRKWSWCSFLFFCLLKLLCVACFRVDEENGWARFLLLLLNSILVLLRETILLYSLQACSNCFWQYKCHHSLARIFSGQNKAWQNLEVSNKNYLFI